jgi:hypothetical protein
MKEVTMSLWTTKVLENCKIVKGLQYRKWISIL